MCVHVCVPAQIYALLSEQEQFHSFQFYIYIHVVPKANQPKFNMIFQNTQGCDMQYWNREGKIVSYDSWDSKGLCRLF